MNPKLTTIFKLLLYTGIFSHLLPLVFFLIFKRDNKENEVRVIFFYIVYCIINEGLGFYFQSARLIDSANFLFAIFNIVEYSFLAYFFYIIARKKKAKKIIIFIWISYSLFAALDFVYFNNLKAFDSFTSGIESLIILLLCIYYLITEIRNSYTSAIYSTSNFWIVISFLIYFSGTFFLYIMAENTLHDTQYQKFYFVINNSFNILKNILLSVAMCMKTNDANKLKPSLPNLGDEVFFNKTT